LFIRRAAQISEKPWYRGPRAAAPALVLQKRLSLAIDEGLRDFQEIDWAEQHRLLASEFGETGGGELDGLPALRVR
jgi:hypothetical protein